MSVRSPTPFPTLESFLANLHQRACDAGLAVPPSPEEQARYAKLVRQHYPMRDFNVGLFLQHVPLWAIHRTISDMMSELFQRGTPEFRNTIIRLTERIAEPVPSEGAMLSTVAAMVAVHIKMLDDLLRLTHGWDTAARRSATLAQVGLPPPEPPPEQPAAPQGTA